MLIDPQFALVGLAVGLLVGLTGMGGGSVTTPLLIMLGLPPTQAIGSDLVFAALTKAVGGMRHAQLRTVEYSLVGWLAVGSVPASLLGVASVQQLKRSLGEDVDVVLQHVLGGALILVGVVVIARVGLAAVRRTNTVRETRRLERRHRAAAVVMGVVFGYTVGLTSIGSGTLFALGLLVLFPLAAARVVGTDIVHASLLVGAAGLGHAFIGNVEWHVVAWLLVGSIPGIVVGSYFTTRLPEQPMRATLGIVLVASGTAIL